MWSRGCVFIFLSEPSEGRGIGSVLICLSCCLHWQKKTLLFHFLPHYLTQSFLGSLSIRLSLSLSGYMLTTIWPNSLEVRSPKPAHIRSHTHTSTELCVWKALMVEFVLRWLHFKAHEWQHINDPPLCLSVSASHICSYTQTHTLTH